MLSEINRSMIQIKKNMENISSRTTTKPPPPPTTTTTATTTTTTTTTTATTIKYFLLIDTAVRAAFRETFLIIEMKFQINQNGKHFITLSLSIWGNEETFLEFSNYLKNKLGNLKRTVADRNRIVVWDNRISLAFSCCYFCQY